MRQEGFLVKWNDERGFGFIRLQGGDEIFVHVSAFGHGSARPQLNEKLTFEIDAGAGGKKKAVRVMRSALVREPEKKPPMRQSAARPPQRRGLPLWLSGLLLVLVGLVGYGVMRPPRSVAAASGVEVQPQPVQPWQPVTSPAAAPVPMPVPVPVPAPVAGQRPLTSAPPRAVPAPVASYRCDGRQHCSQMTSCDEATFFLRNCPGVKMDGDGDGIPCEDQLCGH
jgi:cold shock CspA family protein